jgi:hypothetical protein
MSIRGFWADHRGAFVHEDLKIRRTCDCRRVSTKATGLSAPIVVSPREDLVCGRRGCEPWSNLSIEPCLLLMWVVHCHERSEPVRTNVTGDDQEIAWRDVRQEPVLIAEGDNSHVDRRRQCRIVAEASASTQNLLPQVADRRHGPMTVTTVSAQR